VGPHILYSFLNNTKPD